MRYNICALDRHAHLAISRLIEKVGDLGVPTCLYPICFVSLCPLAGMIVRRTVYLEVGFSSNCHLGSFIPDLQTEYRYRVGEESDRCNYK